jgi:hypothetical protein
LAPVRGKFQSFQSMLEGIAARCSIRSVSEIAAGEMMN